MSLIFPKFFKQISKEIFQSKKNSKWKKSHISKYIKSVFDIAVNIIFFSIWLWGWLLPTHLHGRHAYKQHRKEKEDKETFIAFTFYVCMANAMTCSCLMMLDEDKEKVFITQMMRRRKLM